MSSERTEFFEANNAAETWILYAASRRRFGFAADNNAATQAAQKLAAAWLEIVTEHRRIHALLDRIERESDDLKYDYGIGDVANRIRAALSKL